MKFDKPPLMQIPKIILFITIFIIASCTKSVRMDEASIAQLAQTWQNNNDLLKAQFENNQRKLEESLYSNRRIKFWPLREGVNILRENKNSFEKQAAEIKALLNKEAELNKEVIVNAFDELKNLAQKGNNTFQDWYQKTMAENYEDFGFFDKKGYERWMLTRKTAIESLEINQPKFSFHNNSAETFHLYYLQLEAQFLQSQFCLQQQIQHLTGGRMLTCFIEPVFPIVEANKSYLRIGDTLETYVSVGMIFEQMDVEETVVLVEGDTLLIANAGSVVYKTPITEKGEKTLIFESHVRNLLTGELIKGFTSYTYTVH